MDEANTIHYKALLHAIKYIIDTKDYFYQMKPDRNINGLWEIRGYSYRTTREIMTQKNVTGYIVTINRAINDWLSLSQNTVTLSVT